RLRELDWPPEVLVLTIQREGEHLIPRGSTRLQRGDVLTLLGTPEALEEVERHLRDEAGGGGA
ncbi:MAG: potassium/proton antiporter, partial [Chloroflexi bacterium]|nr:potassium/proton antiporter [Chloroflexota bacterium]